MSIVSEQSLTGPSGRGLNALSLDASRQEQASTTLSGGKPACFHCGEPCPDPNLTKDDKAFCCRGCLFVHDLLAESGLGQFYDLSRHPGVRIRRPAKRERWAYLDDPALQQQLLDFTDGKISRVTFQVPAIHCVACVWLLENLFRLQPGIGGSQVNFPRREVTITFATEKLPLSDLVALLASIGYEPVLTLGELEKRKVDPARKRQWLQVGIAGFAFGNIMLLSLPTYIGLDSLSGPLFKIISGYLSLALAAPALLYSASDYWRSAGRSLRQRVLTLDVPIALGLAALYAQSVYEVVLGRGNGYLDSLAALVFFLLCGRVFQQKTYDRMAFDRDYKCFFPLSVMRVTAAGEESVAISNLRVGDRLRLRNGELIPADGRLLSGPACIDYSFVTGEAETVPKAPGDYLYAGGRQTGGAIEIETVKAVSQSQLTSLWDHEAFRKESDDGPKVGRAVPSAPGRTRTSSDTRGALGTARPTHRALDTLTNRYSRRFTLIVIAVAIGAGVFWTTAGDAARGLKAFISVLIVACPCALALAAPFTFGTAQRLLARMQVFLKNALVLERMAQVDAIVFDKTGTLTCGNAEGRMQNAEMGRLDRGDPSIKSAAAEMGLSDAEAEWVCAVAGNSTHPLAVRVGQALAGAAGGPCVEAFKEIPGCGVEGRVQGHEIRLGSRAWLENCSIPVSLADGGRPGPSPGPQGSSVCLAVDGRFRGTFVLANAVRPETGELLHGLGERYSLALLSGDNEKERERFRELFGGNAALHFNQSPLDKLGFIHGLQVSGRRVMMVGDGLNDAGALKQSDVGVAVVEQAGAFSPASDVILEAGRVPRLSRVLALARTTMQIVRLSFGISAAYNLAGISIAAAGILSPVICAVLMPVSSISVVLFACGATNLAAKRAGLTE